MIDTIFFDIGGVLLNIYPERTIGFLSQVLNLTKEEIIYLFPIDAHHKYECGKLSDEEFFVAVQNNLPDPTKLKESDFWKAWSMMVGSKTPVTEIMNDLSKKYSVWLLSNTNTFHIKTEERLNIFNGTKGAVYSFDVGYRKPDQKIFKISLDMAGANADRSLFIDDLYDNIESARAINMKTIHFKTVEDLKDRLISFNLI